MKEKRKLKLKKFYFHPITVFIFLSLIVVVISALLSGLDMQATYSTVNQTTNELEPTIVAVENLLNFDGIKFIISNATKNFMSFTPLAMLLISLIGISVAEATGFIEAFSRKYIRKIPRGTLTFLIILVATFSSLINEIGYAILIPLVAMIFLTNGRNPYTGIITAFCGVAFGYGVSLFIGSMEVSLMDYTATAARLIDKSAHISLSSNLIFIIAATFILSIIGTIIIEKIIAPKIPKYKTKSNISKTEELRIIDLEEEEQKKIEREKRQKRGLRFALIATVVVILIFIYMLIPGLPNSGLLLDMSEKTYLGQLFGDSSYFQDGFTYMMSLLFLFIGLAYGVGAKSFKNDKDIIEKASSHFADIGNMIILIFVVSQFIAIFKRTNIGVIICAWLVNLLESLQFSGIPLIITILVLIAISNLFLTTPGSKWAMFSPVAIPMLMQSNISPQFGQILMRVGDCMTNGVTPLMAFFVIYIGYLNIYNQDKQKPITIHKAIAYVTPYFIVISITWILLVLGWYIIGIPIGPGVYPTI